MENLPIDAIDLASRVFYSESEGKIYFGDPINGYFEVNTGQLSEVAFSGSYNDLDDKPVIPDFGVMLPLYFIDVVLNKTQINNLNTTPVTIATSDFGLEADEAVKLVPSKMEIFASHDGTPLSQTGNIILSVDIFNVVTIPSLYYIINPDVIFAGFNFTTPAPLIHENWSLQSTSEITGGGTDATIKIRLFYEKIKI